jgi:hypothetical protein
MDTSPTLVTPVLGAATGTSLRVSGQLTSTVATGTAPLAVTSTTPVANLNIGGTAANVTGTVALANGGTGGTTAAAAKTNLALNNVDNTSDANKPVSTATQTALNLKANLASPTFTGTVTAPTFSGNGSALTGLTTSNVAEGTNLYYTDARVQTYVAPLSLGLPIASASAPQTLPVIDSKYNKVRCVWRPGNLANKIIYFDLKTSQTYVDTVVSSNVSTSATLIRLWNIVFTYDITTRVLSITSTGYQNIDSTGVINYANSTASGLSNFEAIQ